MRPVDPKISLTGTWLRETDKAVQFSVSTISGHPIQPSVTEWFPFSQMSRSTKDPERVGGDMLVVSEWICMQKPKLAAILDAGVDDTDPADDEGVRDTLDVFKDDIPF